MKTRLILSPSILAADLSRLSDELKKVKEWGITHIHCDIMDGNFVPNLSFGPKVISDIRKLTDLELDVHLMVSDPAEYIDDFAGCKPYVITFHLEAVRYCFRLIERIKQKGIKVGIALNPGTPIDQAKHLFSAVDLVLLMTVDPGFYGQEFIKGMDEKVRELSRLKQEKGYKFLIEADGGLDEATLLPLQKELDMAVLGKAFFRNDRLGGLLQSLGFKK
jgi:ribulose-phosphate 3-epimerase